MRTRKTSAWWLAPWTDEVGDGVQHDAPLAVHELPPLWLPLTASHEIVAPFPNRDNLPPVAPTVA